MPFKDQKVHRTYMRNYMRKRYREIRKILDFYEKQILPKRQLIEMVLGAPIPEIKVRGRIK